MDFLDITLYFGIAAVAAAINSVAGGGTFLTFPLLILNGLTPLQANVVSTVAMWPGSLASTWAYWHRVAFDRQPIKSFLIISILGSCVGTAALLLLPEVVFTRMVPWLLLFATLIFMFGGHGIGHLDRLIPPGGSARKWAGFSLQFFIAVYGGYFGAGIGILMLAMLQVMGFTHIHQMNALKALLGSGINAVAVLVFILAGKVVWPVAIIMIAGAVTGGYVGARMALHVAPQKIRYVVIAIGALMTVYFFTHGA